MCICTSALHRWLSAFTVHQRGLPYTDHPEDPNTKDRDSTPLANIPLSYSAQLTAAASSSTEQTAGSDRSGVQRMRLLI